MAKRFWQAFLRGASESFVIYIDGDFVPRFDPLALDRSSNDALIGDWYRIGGDMSNAVEAYRQVVKEKTGQQAAHG